MNDNLPVHEGAKSNTVSRRELLGAAAFTTLGVLIHEASAWGKPTKLLADSRPIGSLASAIPTVFNGWHGEDVDDLTSISPDIQQTLDKAYDQIVTRRYRSDSGQEVMLVLAYVRHVTDERRAHSPEICYPAQGFRVTRRSVVEGQMAGERIPVTRFTAEGSISRMERVHYWIVEGNEVHATNWGQKLARMRLGLKGFISDALLVRMSAFDDAADDTLLHFSEDMLNHVGESDRNKLLGSKEEVR